jgi:carbonic anhydrase
MKAYVLALGLCIFSTVVLAESGTHWAYSGKAGPENWGKLTPEYNSCLVGKNQSPINLTGFIKAELPPLTFHYEAGGKEGLNNGHTIQVNYAPGSTISADGKVYVLKQFHFHAPSENLINGKSYPLEAHLVHMDKNGKLAVIAVMFEEGNSNKALEAAFAKLPGTEGATASLSNVAAEDLLPSERGYYRFNGSLTTPPCSEGVLWLVMKAPVTASKEQIEKFTKVMHHPNNRPVQALNARQILE